MIPRTDTTLLIVSSSGDLVSEVNIVDFQCEYYYEGLTEITSGFYQGNFAIIGRSIGIDHHIFIFSIVESGGTVYAFLEKDIVNENLGEYYGICFLSDDHPEYPNHFVLDFGLKVIDFEGNIKGTFDEEFKEITYSMLQLVYQYDITQLTSNGKHSY